MNILKNRRTRSSFFIALTFFLLSTTVSAGIPALRKINVHLFYADVKTSFEEVKVAKPKVELAVRWLFEKNKLNHDYSRAVDPGASFENYWQVYKDRWIGIQMDGLGEFELIFSGQTVVADEQEMTQVFMKFGEIWKEVYWEEGRVLGYQKHPNTGEVLLIQHRYPCCSQYTNTLNRLRMVGIEIQSLKKYFLARDEGMKGNFFPDTSIFRENYFELKDTATLYWSDRKINTGAFLFSQSNAIIRFAPKSRYKRLAKEDGSTYVMFIDPPLQEENELVNPANLLQMKMLGWLIDLP